MSTKLGIDKKNKPLIIFITIIVVVFIGLTIYILIQKNNDVTANWKTYEADNFTLKYPTDWDIDTRYETVELTKSNNYGDPEEFDDIPYNISENILILQIAADIETELSKYLDSSACTDLADYFYKDISPEGYSPEITGIATEISGKAACEIKSTSKVLGERYISKDFVTQDNRGNIVIIYARYIKESEFNNSDTYRIINTFSFK